MGSPRRGDAHPRHRQGQRAARLQPKVDLEEGLLRTIYWYRGKSKCPPRRRRLRAESLARRSSAWISSARRCARSRTSASRCTRGEIFGFLGPNGAGKTTTMKMLMGLIFPTGGAADIFGQQVADVRRQAPPRLSAREPVLLRLSHGRGAPGSRRAPVRHRGGRAPQRARELLERVGLGTRAIGRCASTPRACCSASASPRRSINDPELVVLDEPMSGLDPIGRKEIRDLILELATRARPSSSRRTSCPTSSCSAIGSDRRRRPAARRGPLESIAVADALHTEMVVE